MTDKYEVFFQLREAIIVDADDPKQAAEMAIKSFLSSDMNDIVLEVNVEYQDYTYFPVRISDFEFVDRPNLALVNKKEDQ